MAVDAKELKPRSAIALFDAAVRLSATNAGLWALTMPSGAALIASLFTLAEAIRRDEPLYVPVALFTAAWLFRALTQGAACHYAEVSLLGTQPPSMRASFKAALRHAPGLVTASAWLFVVNTFLFTVTFGIGFLFVGAHTAAYAVVMRGQGSVLGLYGTASKLLGPTRFIAPFVRLCGLSQVLLALNLQLMTMFSLGLLRGLFGFDVTFIDRFTSFDNPVWLAVVAMGTFVLFEPVRAATATLLLIDGRVRQEGLDLIAQLEQLPVRVKPRGVLLAVTLLASAAFADPGLLRRGETMADDCGMHVDLSPLKRRAAESDKSALARMLTRIERRAYDDDDCEGAEAELRESLRLYADAQGTPVALDTRDAAQKILSRPEFQATVEKPDKAEEPKDDGPDEESWLWKLFKKLMDWLFKREPPKVNAPDVGGVSMGAANGVIIGALVLVVAVLAFILIRSIRGRPRAEAAGDENGLTQSALEHDAMSALAKPSETWAGLADELAARGEFREAIRHLYLALLSRLHRDGVIDYDPTLSNWEYLFGFKGSAAVKSAFKELTRRFDFAWYGNLDVDSPSWSTFRQTAEPLLAPAEAPRA